MDIRDRRALYMPLEGLGGKFELPRLEARCSFCSSPDPYPELNT